MHSNFTLISSPNKKSKGTNIIKQETSNNDKVHISCSPPPLPSLSLSHYSTNQKICALEGIKNRFVN